MKCIRLRHFIILMFVAKYDWFIRLATILAANKYLESPNITYMNFLVAYQHSIKSSISYAKGY